MFLFKPNRLVLIIASTLSSVSVISVAQTVVEPAKIQNLPDSSQLQKQEADRQKYLNEQKKLLEKKVESNIQKEKVADSSDGKPAATFTLKEIRFSTEQQLSRTELNTVVAPYLGQPTSYQILLTIRDKVNALYVAKNILTSQAVLRPQKIVDGIVFIELVEGRVGKIKARGNTITDAAYIEEAIAYSKGQLLDSQRLQQRLKDFNSVGIAQINADLAAGSQIGETDVIVNVVEAPRYQGSVFINNEASDSVGKTQIGASLNVNSPFGVNDKISMYVSAPKGSKNGSLTYAIPLGYHGTLLSATYGVGKSSVVAGPYHDLEISGNSTTMQLNLLQNMTSWNEWDLSSNASFNRSKNDNKILDQLLSNLTTDVKTLSLNASGQYPTRTFNINTAINLGIAKGHPQADRTVSTAQLSASWMESFGAGHYTYSRVYMQHASEPILPSVMSMSLGGVGTIRGYPLGVVTGDQGYYANLEWHHPIAGGVSGFTFYDFGSVQTKGYPNLSASSIGAGLNWTWKESIQLHLTVAKPLKDVVPNQGGTRATVRVAWLF